MAMNETALDQLEERIDRLFGRPWLLLILFSIVYFPAALLMAARRPLWFDEIYTRNFCRLPWSQVMRGLRAGIDPQPPLFFAMSRVGVAIAGDTSIGLRIGGLLGVWLAVIGVYRFVSRQTTSLWGAVASVFLLLSMAQIYIAEGRPYGMILGFGCMAIVCWQERARGGSWAWAFGLFFFLGLTLLLHYYAFLAVIPLAGAEIVRTWQNRRADRATWTAILASSLLLPLHIELVRSFMRVKTAHFWNQPYPSMLPEMYRDLLGNGLWAIVMLALALAAILILPQKPAKKLQENTVLLPEAVLGVLLLALPAIGFGLGVVSVKMMSARYAILATVGMAWTFSVLGRRMTRRPEILGGLTMVALSIAFAWGFSKELHVAKLSRLNTAPYLEIAAREKLPIALSDVRLFMAMYDQSPAIRPHLLAVVNADAEAKITGESNFGGLPTVGMFFNLPIDTWEDFVRNHRTFLVLLSGDWPDWILPTVIEQGGRAEIVRVDGKRQVFRIELSKDGAAAHPIEGKSNGTVR